MVCFPKSIVLKPVHRYSYVTKDGYIVNGAYSVELYHKQLNIHINYITYHNEVINIIMEI